MGSETPNLHIFFLPFLAHGHMIPSVDMAKQFASRGVKTSIITTPLNAPLFSKTIERSKNSGIEIDIKIINFPAVEAGLPQGFEIIEPSKEVGMETFKNFTRATNLLQESVERLLEEFKPDCLVADMLFPWATDAANKFGIPRLVFHGTCFFSMCVTECLSLYEPQKKVESEYEPFIVPNLPGDIVLSKSKMPDFEGDDDESVLGKVIKASKEADLKSYGVVFNSFYELEADYAYFYKNVLGRKAWHIGPVSLCNKAMEDKAERGKKASIDEHECLKWLDSKKPNSVIYICFGSMFNLTVAQLKELAMGLEASGQDFIWVERFNEKEDAWLPEGFENRMEGRGLIIEGWAPQVLILEHAAVGGFVTHCGWNSTLEGVCAGVPLVTWPIAGEQFYNEKLMTDVLRIGVPVGVKKWFMVGGDFVEKDAIETAVKDVMVGEKAEDMRSRAKALGEMARKAVEKDGSSYLDFDALIQELNSQSHQ